MSARVHIVGAGLSGLSAAVQLAKSGLEVSVYEAAGHAGGRCRSFFDTTLERDIDNGNHLVLSGNHAVFDYLNVIGATDHVRVAPTADIPFLDLADGTRWSVRPDRGRIPWSWLSKARRVPGSTFGDYVRSTGILRSTDDQTVADVMATQGALWDRFWAPFIVAVTNTAPEKASAGPMGRVVHETLAKGEAACRPVFFPDGLSPALVTPALDYLAQQGSEVLFNRRLRRVETVNGKLKVLDFGDSRVDLNGEDVVVAALPPGQTAAAIGGFDVPDAYSPIVNGHFRLPAPISGPAILGLVNASAEWLFLRSDIVSVTVSAANDMADEDAVVIAQGMWSDILEAYGLGNQPLGPHRIVKEKRATFLQTPAQIRRRAICRTDTENLYLAGDWTETGLPATIEGSLRSGRTAAREVLRFFGQSPGNT